MLLVKDPSNKTVGHFVNYKESKLGPVACDDDDITEDSEAVLGHMDAHIKSWPIEVDWKKGNIALDNFKVQGMVVVMIKFTYVNICV
ncbi:hypothetical protein BJ944DRAFT_154379 [Cunninghamella echinulata]|nr:hypothetical protein BJ944DRAFT_154379 [Cunninghamella echinulata]